MSTSHDLAQRPDPAVMTITTPEELRDCRNEEWRGLVILAGHVLNRFGPLTVVWEPETVQ